MSLMHTFFKKAFLRKLAQAFPFPRGVNEIGLPMRDKSKRVFHPDDPAKMIQQRQKFDYGDVVEVLRNGAGLKAGSTGTVKGLRIRDDGDLDYLVVTDTEQKLIRGRDLAPTNKPKQMVERPKFPVGSRVETPRGSGYVRGWPEVGGFDYYEINADDSPVDYDMHVGKIRPYGQQQQQPQPAAPQTSSGKIGVGSIVRVDTGGHSVMDGEIGTVESYDQNYGGWTVKIDPSAKFPKGGRYPFQERYLKLIYNNQSSGQPKFKLGDIVMTVVSRDTAEIVGWTRSNANIIYDVEMQSGPNTGNREKRLESELVLHPHIPQNTPQKLKPGDQVKIKNSKAYAGIVGILKSQNSWGQWDVDFPSINSTVGGWSDNDLELVP